MKKIKYWFYKYILRHKFYTSWDLGSPDGDHSVLVRYDRKGNMIIEEINKSF